MVQILPMAMITGVNARSGRAATGLPGGPLACLSDCELSQAPPGGLILTRPLPGFLTFSPGQFIDHLLPAFPGVSVPDALFTDAVKRVKNPGAQGGTATKCHRCYSCPDRPDTLFSMKPS